MTEFAKILVGFAILALAADRLGHFFRKMRLPLISGFLFCGILVGPYALDLLPKSSLEHLRFLDEIALAIIAFAAGNELYLPELRGQLRTITFVTVGQLAATFVLGTASIVLMAPYIPFLRDLPTTHWYAAGILAAAILVARSPSSAIAIVNELRAKGPFTRMVLGVTMAMDVIVIMFFAINSEIAVTLFTDQGFNVGSVLLIVGELLLSVFVGYLVSLILNATFALRLPAWLKLVAVPIIGYGVFRGSAYLREFSHQHLPFELLLEPLLICMVGSVLLTNRSSYRDEFGFSLEKLSPPIYVVFFTLTGASLALDILLGVWQVALVLVVVRLVGILLGSLAAGVLSGQSWQHSTISWMTFVTQAGVGLGLAREVADEFPQIGAAFATLMIAVIVINQLIGPPLFKWAISKVGEAHVRAEPGRFDGTRDVVIFGLTARSLALAKQLAVHDWSVKIATLTPPEEPLATTAEIRHVEEWSLETLKELELDQAESIVCMLSDDEENYRICELAYEHFGVENMVVQLRDRENRRRFQQLGVLIVEPETAVVTLLEQFVRSPAGASLLLGMEPGHDIIDVEVRNPTLDGMAIRDLRMPLDVLVLSIHRGNQALSARGHTVLRLGDRITLSGPVEKLEELSLRFEG